MALADLLAARVVRPVTVGWLDFQNDPVYGWTGPGAFAPTGTGDADLDGNTFLQVEGALMITDFVENQELGAPITITFAAGEMVDEPVVQQVIADRRAFMARRAKFWRFFLLEDESGVEADFAVLFNGIMTSVETRRVNGEGAVIVVTCDQDIQKARAMPVRWIDHQVFYPSDTASQFMNATARGGVASAVASGIGAPTPLRIRSLPTNER